MIGDNVYIGPGAILYGPIAIADNIAIGANALVNRSFVEPDITIAGVPARQVSSRGTSKIMDEPARQQLVPSPLAERTGQ